MTRIRNSRTLAGLTAAVALAVSFGAQASVITNGGFETGDFSGWTVTGDVTSPYTGVSNFVPNSGKYAAYFGTVAGASVGISQILNIFHGAPVHLSFAMNSENDSSTPANAVSVMVDGQEIFGAVDLSASGYQVYKFDFMANANSDFTKLEFKFINDMSFFNLDDVVAKVPEPSSLPLVVLAGGLALGWSRRRRSA